VPRKKLEKPSNGSEPQKQGAGAIECPACKSKIAPDGGTLHSRSQFLVDLLETEKSVDELEKLVGQLEAETKNLTVQLEQARAELKNKGAEIDVLLKEKKRGWW